MTNPELAILSLVAEKPRHGYEIEQVIEEREMRNWTEIGFSSIYYVLNKLEKEGLIESHTAPPEGRGPARKVYKIKAEGVERWQAATLEVLSNHKVPASPFQLGLANLPALPKDEVLQALLNYREQLRETRAHVEERRTMLGEIPPFNVSAMFDLSTMMMDAELQWLDEFIADFEKQEI